MEPSPQDARTSPSGLGLPRKQLQVALLDLAILLGFHLREEPEEKRIKRQRAPIECKTGGGAGEPRALTSEGPSEGKAAGGPPRQKAGGGVRTGGALEGPT